MKKQPRPQYLFTAVLAVFAGGLLFFMVQQSAVAQTPFSIDNIGSNIGLGTADLKETVLNIIRWFLGILTLLALVYVGYGGFLYLTSQGEEQKIDKAKRTIINALIGLAIVLLSWAIVFFVARFVSSATTGSDTTCAEDTTRNFGCEICKSDAWVPNPDAPEPDKCHYLGFTDFTLDSIATSYALPGNVNENVTLCSNVLHDFNNFVDQASVDAAVLDPLVPLRIIKVSDGIPFDGTWQTLSDTVTFRHNKFCTGTPTLCSSDSECSATPGTTCDVVTFAKNTDYEIQIPKYPYSGVIKDTTSALLKLCKASPNCDASTSDEYFIWSFTTGEENDTAPPTITSSYPVNSGPTYPDMNVDRQPILDVNFNEAVDPGSVMDVASGELNDSNVFIERLDGERGDPVVVASDTDASPVDGKVDAEKWKVTFDSDGFRLSLVNPLALESFTWYRITVQNIEDLCGNGLSAPVVWEFQTNDAIASIVSVYPQGENQCPDTKIAAVFGASMYQNDVQFIVTGDVSMNLTIPSPEMTDDTEVDDGTHVLRILDPYPGGYKQYELSPFELTSGSLPLNANFTVQIITDRKIDASGTTLGTSWGFSTSTPETCACAPLVTAINPNQGGPGQCATVFGYCFTGTAANPASPTSVTVGGEVGTPMIQGTPTEAQIVTTVSNTLSTVGPQPVEVAVTYTNPAFGTLTSNNTVNFNLNTLDPSVGPCLISLSPNEGYTNTQFDANGERFGSTPGSIRFGTFTPAPLTWANERVRTTVPATAPAGPNLVRITDAAGQPSNGLNFKVLVPPPDQLVVIGAEPTCGTACINTLLSARFNKAVNTGTLTGSNIRVRRCQSDTCAWNLLDSPLGTIAVDPAGWNATDKQFTFSNTENFEPNTWYRVVLSGGTGGLVTPADELLATNFDEDNDGTNDAYSWTFKTKDDPTACSVNSVDLNPFAATIGTIGGTHNYISEAIGSPDSCNPEGQPINVGSSWTWGISSPAAVPEVQFVSDADAADNLQTVEALSETILPPPPDYVNIEACTSGLCDDGKLTVDVTWCDEVTDCEDLDIGTPGPECPGSYCDIATNTCVPVINSLSPASGDIGTWVTVNGCYFDSYDTVKSKVIFTDNKTGLCLPTALCGSCASQWSNSQVVVEVPDDSTPPGDDAETGLVRLNTRGGFTATSPAPFTVVSGEVHPGLCRLVPDSGPAGTTAVGLYGTGFADSQGTGFVEFAVGQNANPVVSWANELVNVIVPTFAETGLVSVTQNGIASNGLNFTVVPGACAAADICTSDAACGSPDRGCGVGGCCAARPQVSATSPADGAGSVCRNAGIEITFDQPMNPASLADITHYTVSPGSFTIGAITSTSVVLNPGLMVATTPYAVTVSGNVESAVGVKMNADKAFTFTTGDAICDLASVDVQPGLTPFTATGMSQTLTAQALSSSGDVLIPQPTVYDWSWGWTTSRPLTANFSALPSGNQATLVTQSENGDAVVTATATLLSPNSGSRSGTAVVRLTLPAPPGDVCGTFNACTEGCPAGQGCGTGECCSWQPQVVSINPVNGATDVCRNTGILVVFDQPMDSASLGTLSNYPLSPGTLASVQVMTDRVLLRPDILNASTLHTVTISGNVKSALGVTMGSNVDSSFTTSTEVCKLESVDVTPLFHTEADSGIPVDYGAVAIGTGGFPIVETTAYTWAWQWTTSNAGVGNFNPAADDNPAQTVVTGSTSGTTTITARATADLPNTESVAGSGILQLTLPPGPTELCPGSTTCTTDGECAGTPGLPACGTSGCCVARPQVASTNPPDNATDVCRNAGISVTFDRPMQTASLSNPANYLVSPGGFTITAVTADTVFLKPDPFPLDSTKTYTVTVKNSVVSTEGVGLATDYVFDFTTSDSFCELDHVSMIPKLWISTTAGETKDFLANTYAASGIQIYSAPDVYSWKWGWTTSNDAVAAYTASFPAAEDNDQQEARTGTVNGTSTLMATATVDQPPNIVRFDTALVQLESCENPWGIGSVASVAPPSADSVFIDSDGNCATGSCTDYDFTLFYCRGNGSATLLPDFTEVNVKGDIGTDIKKQYLFKATGSDDAIGIRIISNPGLLSPDVWFQQQFPFETAAPQSMVVDGYPAVRDGRTVYVAATRFTSLPSPKLDGYIFLISHNQDASPETLSIFNAFLNSWRFNAGESGASYLPGLGPVDKLAVSHDMSRLGDLSKIARALGDFHETNGTYPALSAGSFITGISTSRWNTSWNSTLGNMLGRTLPVDPLNIFYNCPPEKDGWEQQSCWNEASKNFQCNDNSSPTPDNPDSHIYLYDAAADGSSYTLYANLEYTKAGTWMNGAGDPCSGAPGGSTCSCFNFNLPPS